MKIIVVPPDPDVLLFLFVVTFSIPVTFNSFALYLNLVVNFNSKYERQSVQNQIHKKRGCKQRQKHDTETC